MHSFEQGGAAEEKQHSTAVQDLASAMGMAAEEVRRVYDMVLFRYRRHARIRDFLPILVSRRVRDLIMSRRRRQQGVCSPEEASLSLSRGRTMPERRIA